MNGVGYASPPVPEQPPMEVEEVSQCVMNKLLLLVQPNIVLLCNIVAYARARAANVIINATTLFYVFSFLVFKLEIFDFPMLCNSNKGKL